MNEAKNLLHFEFPSQFFQVSAIDMVPNHINLRIAARINTLRKIGEGYKMDDLPPQDRIKTIYIKLIHSIDKQGEIENQFSNRELRILSYGLHYKTRGKSSIMENEVYLDRYLNLLDSNWRFRYVYGLLHCYLSSWMEVPSNLYLRLFYFIREKLKNYTGTRDRFLSLKNNFKYFEAGRGDVYLGATLAMSNVKLTEVAMLLNIPKGWITYSYFFRVINTYLEKSKERLSEVFDDIALFLERHSNPKTNKVIIYQYRKDLSDRHIVFIFNA